MSNNLKRAAIAVWCLASIAAATLIGATILARAVLS